MLGVFIYELVLNGKAQGTPFSFKVCADHMPFVSQLILLGIQPAVNPMLGPSASALINAGARYPPCMKDVAGLPLSTRFPCASSSILSTKCH